MPASHQFTRRIAAIGAALALVALPIAATTDAPPALAQPSSTDAADTEGSVEAVGAADGADSANANSDANGSDSAETGSDSATAADSDSGADSGNNDGASNGVTGDDPDDDEACAPPDGGDPEPGTDGPCEIEGQLEAEWDPGEKTLSVDPDDLPESWVGVAFEGPEQDMVRVPAQSSQHSAGDDSGRSVGSDSDTDDSGQSVAEATDTAAAPSSFEFNADGEIMPAGGSQPMKFERFDSDPKWTFRSDGKNIIANGRKYPDSNDDADSGASDGSDSDDGKDGSDNDSPTAGDTAEATSDSDSTSSANRDADGSRADSDSGSGSSSDSDSGTGSAARGDTSTDSDTSADSGPRDRADASADEGSDGSNSNAEAGSQAEGSRSSDSDSSASGSDSGEDDNEDSEGDDGSGSSLGTADADGTTPDPSTGNGSQNGRQTIPGTTGDEWLPGDEDDSQHPDYSDPVPQNPDAPTPKDDTDLITGGDQPSPRANQNPSPSFGESIISTIVSSWPVFVLAASGMAAVGFIIYLMGRRGKQE